MFYITSHILRITSDSRLFLTPTQEIGAKSNVLNMIGANFIPTLSKLSQRTLLSHEGGQCKSTYSAMPHMPMIMLLEDQQQESSYSFRGLKHNTITYHKFRKSVAAGVQRIAFERGIYNVADFLTKNLVPIKLKDCRRCALF